MILKILKRCLVHSVVAITLCAGIAFETKDLADDTIDQQRSSDVLCAAATVYHEARGESPTGKLAVAFVVRNRAEKWRRGVCEVAMQSKGKVCQFTGLCFKDKLPYDQASLDAAYKVFVNRNTIDPTHGATHYHTPAVKPLWAKVYPVTTRIGKHIFYRGKDPFRVASSE